MNPLAKDIPVVIIAIENQLRGGLLFIIQTCRVEFIQRNGADGRPIHVHTRANELIKGDGGEGADQTLGARVVLKLCQHLFDKLLQKGLYRCGTVRPTAKGFPNELKIPWHRSS